ncbi:MAG TPA: hypothetical protein VK463_13100 [Desulfomonilaceae bacterium]|nr:hypothetical protein [Desulfomonilaceae bacterium]
MKTISCIVALILCASAHLAFGQAKSMYDQSYQGPMNIYGQPVLTPVAKQQNQPPEGFPGVFPLAGAAVQGAGSYLWGYMPAPVRGAQSPYYVPPGTGQVITNFTPGTR